MFRSKTPLALLAAASLGLPLLGGCSELEAQEFEREIHSLVDDLADELEETRKVLEGTLDEEARAKLESLRLRVEQTAVRLGERHLDDLRAFLAEDSIERFLDGLESESARSWDALRDELESGAGQLRTLVDRWADEVDERAELLPRAEPTEPRPAAGIDLGPFDA